MPTTNDLPQRVGMRSGSAGFAVLLLLEAELLDTQPNQVSRASKLNGHKHPGLAISTVSIPSRKHVASTAIATRSPVNINSARPGPYMSACLPRKSSMGLVSQKSSEHLS